MAKVNAITIDVNQLRLGEPAFSMILDLTQCSLRGPLLNVFVITALYCL
jgi:hypothetical protein